MDLHAYISGEASYTVAVKKKKRGEEVLKEIQQVGFWGKGLFLQPIK